MAAVAVLYVNGRSSRYIAYCFSLQRKSVDVCGVLMCAHFRIVLSRAS